MTDPGGHLSLQEQDLPPAAEWPITARGWWFIRLSHGIGYCFGAPQKMEIVTGDLLTVPPGKSIILRASQLGPVRLHYFQFQPELLNAVLSVAERKRFSALAGSPGQAVTRLAASHPAARQFAAITQCSAPEARFLERSRMLTLAATIFAPDLCPPARPFIAQTTVRARFRDLMQTMPQAEMLNHSTAELASLCRCSPRYFKRLFRSNFGFSLRTGQAELRLEKACQLLEETNAGMAWIALDCGYRSPRVFGSLFKKSFGITPHQWRKNAKELKNPGLDSAPAHRPDNAHSLIANSDEPVPFRRPRTT